MIITKADMPQTALGALNLLFEDGDTTVKINVFTNDVVPDPALTKSQFTTPSSGIANETVTFNDPVLDENGQYHLLCPSVELENTDTVTVGPAFGYVVWCEGGANLLWWAERFDTPVSFSAGSKKYISPDLILPGFTGSATLNW